MMARQPDPCAKWADTDHLDHVAEAFARTRRICDRIAPYPPLNLGTDGYQFSRRDVERWFEANTRARDFRRDHAASIRARILAKIERLPDDELLAISKGHRRFNRQEGRRA